MNPHSEPVETVLRELATRATGLTREEACRRLKEHGANALKEQPGEPLWRRFLAQFEDTMILILLVAAGVSAFLGETVDAVAIVAIILLNAVLGFTQEYRAEQALKALKRLSAQKARVLRSGKEEMLDAAELVPGDIILLNEGDRVPADCRLLEVVGMRVDEAMLTGESMPVDKDLAPVSIKAGLAERHCLAYSGTTVIRGRGKAAVTSTGMETEMGKIAGLVQQTDSEKTPLQQQLAKLGKTLGVAALAACAVIFAVGAAEGRPLLEMFLVSVSLAVAAIPEGLPAVVTITLAVGVQRMAKRNAIIRRLPAVETLGAATVICSDKTGTLTKNEMTVREIVTPEGAREVTGEGYSLAGEVRGGKGDAALGLLLEAGCLCNNSTLAFDSTKTKATPLGDPTEASLLVAAAKAGLDYEALRASREFHSEEPFTSERKMMSVTRRNGSAYRVYAKGAPEEILKKCTHILKGGGLAKLTDAERAQALAENTRLASKALRVLGLAYRDVDKAPRDGEAERELVFLGLAGMNDPPRGEAIAAVAACKSAGIRVIMITGDNPETAAAIGRELGLLARDSRVMTGPEIDETPDLSAVVDSVAIYARVSPEHKLRIVDALKKKGAVVAMTGDGVNDAPAIKRADIGVAMGITGTDVSKEASDMVVADDNFASIVAAVEEGRTIYSNIVKAVVYLVSCNVGELVTIFAAILAGLASPLTAVEILWMNLVTDSLPALALAVEPTDKDLMRKPPREKSKPILGMHNAKRVALVGAWMAAGTLALYAAYLPQGLVKAETVAFSTIVLFQLFYAFDCRSDSHLGKKGLFSNKWMLAAFATGVTLQGIIVYAPFAQPVFGTVALETVDAAAILAVSASLTLASQARKFFENK